MTVVQPKAPLAFDEVYVPVELFASMPKITGDVVGCQLPADAPTKEIPYCVKPE
jgi:hypothetical protein